MKMVCLRNYILQGDGNSFCIGIVEYLLEAGNTINDTDHHGFTFLHYAAQHGQFKILTCLLMSHKADVHVRTVEGETPFMLAAENGRIRIMELLRQYGAQINIRDNSESTALIKAVRHKYKYAVLFLLERDVFLNAKDKKGHTAVSHAARTGQRELVELLIDKGADVTKALKCKGAQFVGRSFIQTRVAQFIRRQREIIEHEHTMKLYAQSTGFNLGFNTSLKRKFIRIIKEYLFEPTQIEFRNIFQEECNQGRRDALLFRSRPMTVSVRPRSTTPPPQTSQESTPDVEAENIVYLFGACSII